MKKTLLVTALIGSLSAAPMAMAVELDTLEKKASYLMGLKIGPGIIGLGYELDVEALKLGIKESVQSSGYTLSNEELKQVSSDMQQRYSQRQIEKRAAQAKVNLEAGQSFLAENGKNDGVITTASGLQYKIISEGTGAKPIATDSVQVHYRGTLLDGTEFDSSYKRGEPVTFPLNGVIAGWTEGLQIIKQGTKAAFYIPSQLAYGENGTPGIDPNSTLIFEVELLAINPEPAVEKIKPTESASEAK